MAGVKVMFVGEMYYTDLGVGGGPVYPPGQPPSIWPGRPEHPIVLPPPDGGGGYPPSIWPGRPEHPIVIPPDAIAPGVPTHPIYLPVYPWHPIVIPPDTISPGVPAHPIVLPPFRPEHPIVIPPDAVAPGVPAHPIYLPPTIWPDPNPPGIWGGGNVPMPTPPIYLPGPGSSPPGFWGPNDPRPTPPIYLPPDALPPDFPKPPEGKSLVVLWVPGVGYKMMVIPTPGAPGNMPPSTQPTAAKK